MVVVVVMVVVAVVMVVAVVAVAVAVESNWHLIAVCHSLAKGGGRYRVVT